MVQKDLISVVAQETLRDQITVVQVVQKDLISVVVQEIQRNQITLVVQVVQKDLITLVVEEVFHCQWLQHGHNNYC